MTTEIVYSKYQQAVFDDQKSGKGHTFIEAYAGSAKTTTIVEAIKYVPNGADVLFCAFNKRIAEELENRVSWDTTVKTLHALGIQALKENGVGTQLDKYKVGGILSKMFANNAGATSDLRERLGKAISLCKSSLASEMQEIDEVLGSFNIDVAGAHMPGVIDAKRDRSTFIERVQTVLEECKRPNGKIDFDDMVWLPNVLDIEIPTFDRVFIDETQDLSASQVELALKSCKKNGRICAVGDRRQAIYNFGGADEHAIENIIQRYSAKVLPLPICYRCPREVVKLAQTIVPEIQPWEKAKPGSVRNISKEKMHSLVRPGDFILSRKNAPLIGLCMRYLKDGRRAMVQGRDIGTKLAAFVKKSCSRTVPALISYTDSWEASEIARISKSNRLSKKDEISLVSDTAECMRSLSEHAQSIDEVYSILRKLFEDADDHNSIVLSTVHKAKGLERENVFLLEETFKCRVVCWTAHTGGQENDWTRERMAEMEDNIEESNLFYVACTRSQSSLYLVT